MKRIKMKNKLTKYMVTLALVSGGAWSYMNVYASDHDDGSQASAQNNLNLTDLFVFREDNQTGNAADKGNLVLIMDSNGHTPAGQQVYFSTAGRYEFHIGRVGAGNVNVAPTGAEDAVLRFTFAEPDANNHQAISMTLLLGGVVQATTVDATHFLTTSLVEGQADTLNISTVMTANQNITVFAGLREDPFFFDVEQFFKVRAGALGQTAEVGFLPAAQAVDGFAKQNVNSIVVRVPIALLQTAGSEPAFDVWETTSKI
jgi:hypothetical protein